ncbi:radical SAM protein [Methylobacterium sp. NEAU K]|uniref:radical SAM protein n=1 Tax=Methylobacterium sp. NEAU K TaxID=3064946 RepID=UPI002736C182|nr:hypothetical protein [Methylobacterium sp. NEAU K]MDP4006391.1 hypothetical protein [Methylobacterium sp. NEAU K]
MMRARGLDTPYRDASLRSRIIDPETRSVLVSRICGTLQERDLSAPTNCDGLGRVRHFQRHVLPGWPDNPLPIAPAARWLGVQPPLEMTAQVFQLAACAWRCWYCYVPYSSLRAAPERSVWRTADALVDAYLGLNERPPILDLSGGSPDLAPEWIAWTLEAVERRGASRTTFVWSDDNLSSDRLLDGKGKPILDVIARYPNYGRACCLKGLDAPSFAFNTRAHPDGFERQLTILAGYARSAIDIYVYLPLVGPPSACPRAQVEAILERLIAIRPDLPARTVPLFIGRFQTMVGRIDASRERALERQWELLEHWETLTRAVALPQ